MQGCQQEGVPVCCLMDVPLPHSSLWEEGGESRATRSADSLGRPYECQPQLQCRLRPGRKGTAVTLVVGRTATGALDELWLMQHHAKCGAPCLVLHGFHIGQVHGVTCIAWCPHDDHHDANIMLMLLLIIGISAPASS